MTRAGIVLRLAAGALLALAAAACTTFNQGRDASLLLQDIRAGTGASELKALTPPPTRGPAGFAWRGRHVPADLYRPGEQALGTLVLLHGFTPDGRRDPRLVALARSLARVRFNVLAPEIEGFRALDVDPEDAGLVRAAFRRVSRDPDLAPNGRAGILAVSFGVGPALMAALDPAIAACVDVVGGIGAYYDLPAALVYLTTGEDPLSPGRERRKPNPAGRWLMLLSNLEHVAQAGDRRLLRRIAEARLRDPHAPVERLASRLSPDGARVYRFLANTDPERAAALWGALPAALRRSVGRLDLAARPLHRLRADLLLVHGRDDTLMPVSHARALVRAVPPGQGRLYVVPGLGHVDVEVGLSGVWALWRAMSELLAHRDMHAAPSCRAGDPVGSAPPRGRAGHCGEGAGGVCGVSGSTAEAAVGLSPRRRTQ